MEAGGWRLGNGESGSGESGSGESEMGTREPGLGTGDTGLESRELLADSRCGNQLSAYRFPNLLTIFFK